LPNPITNLKLRATTPKTPDQREDGKKNLGERAAYFEMLEGARLDCEDGARTPCDMGI
jgi:hypothetical protein